MTGPDVSDRRPRRQTVALFAIVCGAFLVALWLGRANVLADRASLAGSLVLSAGLLVLSWIDLDRFLLPDALTRPLIVLGLAANVLLGGPVLWSVAGAVVGYGVIFGLNLYWRRFRGQEGIGLGDAKLLAAGGAWLGLFALPFILLVASGSALVLIGLLSLVSKSQWQQVYLPFGPALAFAIWLAWCLPQFVPHLA
ncbi:MAG: prepilin peptidase [Alphaproteobacteria bacterium]|nr:prepilin peptidase [Alphaproteobacteria bacterium]